MKGIPGHSKLWPEGLGQSLLVWDRALTARLTLLSTTRADLTWRRLASGVAHTGDGILWIVGAALTYTVGRDGWSEIGRRVLLATCAGGGTIWLLKLVFRRQRPTGESYGLYYSLDAHSFPSGHAGRNASVVFYLMPLLSLPVQIGLLGWLLVMGLSRVALGIHYVSDVLVGFLVGSAIGWLMR